MKLVLLVVLLFATNIFAQNFNLKGRVTDENENPLYLANVVLLNSNTGVTTNQEGEFSLKAEFESNEKITISYVGYKPITINFANLNLAETNLFELKKIPFTSQTVLVKGSIGEEGVTPMAFAKVTQKEIEESYVHQDVPEYLSYLPSTTFYSE
ncbi:MAG: carboxypeptidase-like regulatory domain-containing protein, partial [Melioribacteraceae bacterium]|nr:carboxypeptidase-like regulatory domain-containing protein [Melioribacteraceae bacterium]